MKTTILTMICGVLFAASAASAQPIDPTPDVRCVVAMAAMIRNPAYKDGATAGLFYYLGRLDARDPAFDLGPAMRRERMAPVDIAQEGRRCGAAVAERNKALQGMSANTPSRGVGR